MSATTTPPGTLRGRRQRQPGKPKRPTGRPPLPPGERYEPLTLLRLPREEGEIVRAAARMLGETLAEFAATASLRRAEATLQANAELSNIE